MDELIGRRYAQFVEPADRREPAEAWRVIEVTGPMERGPDGRPGLPCRTVAEGFRSYAEAAGAAEAAEAAAAGKDEAG